MPQKILQAEVDAYHHLRCLHMMENLAVSTPSHVDMATAANITMETIASNPATQHRIFCIHVPGYTCIPVSNNPIRHFVFSQSPNKNSPGIYFGEL